MAIPAELRASDSDVTGRRFGLHSQFEEDGILLALHERTGACTRRFVEIGCGGNGGNSGTLAAELGWHGLMVDTSPTAVATAAALNPATITGVAEWITRDNVNDLIERNGFAGDVDQLSIDIDGNDYWIFEQLTACRPRVLIMEYNSSFGPHAKVTVPYDEDFHRTKDSRHGHLYFGASLGALHSLAEKRGYGLVAVEPTGANAFFVADGLAPDLRRRQPFELYRMLPKHRAAVANQNLFDEMAADGLELVTVGPEGRRVPKPRTATPTRLARERFFDVQAPRFASFVGIENQRGRYIVSLTDDTVGRSLLVSGKRSEFVLLEQAVRMLDDAGLATGGCFVDCGANIGTSVIPALLGGRFTSAVCFEPHPDNVRTLKANIALNGLDDRVITIAAAVSRVSGWSELIVHPTNSGAHELAVDSEQQSPELPDVDLERLEVPTVTLDEALAQHGLAADVGVLWLDVQGHEGAVLAGARTTLEAGAPVVLEYYPELLERAGDLDELHTLVEGTFTHVVDLRRAARLGDAEWQPIEDLRSMAGARALIDVLVARL